MKREPETGKSARFIMTENADTAALFFCNFAWKQNVRTKKKGLVSLIFIIVASTIYSQTLKNYCDTARNYIIDGKTTPVLSVLPKVYGSFMTENVRFTAHKKLR